ncbi:MAG TPA: DUF3862 domain-containing protein [bacterium]|nr:DUF3862 domain-containing protein [bacterium]
MSMIKCKECGKEVSSEAKACPNCGVASPKKMGIVKKIFIGIFGFFAIMIILGAIIEKTDTSAPDGGFSLPSIGDQVITYAEYIKIKEGMTYEEVAKIIGAPGKEESRTTIPGVSGFSKSVIMVSYGWMNENGSNASLTFENNKVTMKVQFGLE